MLRQGQLLLQPSEPQCLPKLVAFAFAGFAAGECQLEDHAPHGHTIPTAVEMGPPITALDFRHCFVDLARGLGLQYWLVRPAHCEFVTPGCCLSFCELLSGE